MKSSIRILICLAAAWFMALSVSRAGDLTLPHSFQSGTPAVAAEVNGNFSVSRYATVIGGGGNSARGFYSSSISGGVSNTAGGEYSSVSGGEMRMVTGNDDWRAGSLFEDR